jgi:hypothetical protein
VCVPFFSIKIQNNKFFFNFPSRDGQGGKEKYMIYAAIGTVCVLGALTYLELNSREITWKEFINGYFSFIFQCYRILIYFLFFEVILLKEWSRN